jgi:DNA-binding CsgD family transcriptional regulator
MATVGTGCTQGDMRDNVKLETTIAMRRSPPEVFALLCAHLKVQPATAAPCSVVKIVVASDSISINAAIFPLLPINHEAIRARFKLSPSQLKVALLIAARLTNREVAEALNISENTARKHAEWVFSRTGVTSRDRLVYVLGNYC